MQLHIQPHIIQKFISNNKISQNQLAMEIGVTRGYICRIVRGKFLKPGNQVIAGLLYYTSIPFEELFIIVPDLQPYKVANSLPSYSSNLSSDKIILLNS